ncbi:MAG: pilin [Patescibacteria group bacterium]
MKRITFLGLSIVVLTPAMALAADLDSVLDKIGDLIGTATPIIVALALIFFFYGLAKYILNSGDEEKRTEGKGIMIWGIIALFVMVSVWGLVNLLANTFEVNDGSTINIPSVTL